MVMQAYVPMNPCRATRVQKPCASVACKFDAGIGRVARIAGIERVEPNP
jgi:hypothetical protein